jgi:SHOCT-like protein
MSEETRQVLEMLSQGKINVQEAEQLLQAVPPVTPSGDDKKVEPRYFRILVNKPAREGKKAEAVNIRVPMTVVRGGLRLGALFPSMLGKKTIQLDNGMELDLSKITYTDLEALIRDIGELTVDVDGGDAQVRIRCE